MDNKYEMCLDLPTEVKQYFQDNNLNLKQQIDATIKKISNTPYYDFKIINKSYSLSNNMISNTKNLFPTIIACGASTYIILIAINKIVNTILRKPQIIQIDSKNSTKYYNLIDPKNGHNESELNIEFGSFKVKFKNRDEN